MMLRFPRIPVLLCILSLVSHPGCTVKENRDLCSARLELAFQPLETAAVVRLGTTTGPRTDRLPAGATEYHAEVERGTVPVLVRMPADLPFAAGSELRIPEGEECPEVRLFYREYEIRGERVRDSVRLRKNYCTLDLRVISREGAVYSFAVVGGWCGYDGTGRPLAGAFRCGIRPDAEGRARLRVPRQGDDALLLELSAENGTVRCFALGEYMREAGYDWTAEDLDDTEVIIDYVRTSITLSARGWIQTFVFEMVI